MSRTISNHGGNALWSVLGTGSSPGLITRAITINPSYWTDLLRLSISSLERAFVLALRVKIEVHGIVGKVDVYRVGSFNQNAASALRAGALHFDLFPGQRKFQFLGALKHRVPNHIVALAAVGAQASFRVKRILKLVVREVGRNNLRAHVSQAAQQAQYQNQFKCAHDAFRLWPCGRRLESFSAQASANSQSIP